jgi:ABC-type antimicrobial peptide transport system permease subunit
MYALYNAVDATYFETLGIELVAGRGFTTADRAGAPPVVVINETLAERLWPGESPLGRQLVGSSATYEVVGVTRDGKYISFRDGPTSFVFLSSEQNYSARRVLHVRARTDAGPMIEELRRQVAIIDPNVAVESAEPLSTLIGFTLFPQQVAATMVGIFAILGLVLAGIGVYGVLSHQVAQRAREFGIRVALGATASDIRKLVVGRGAVISALGTGVGLILAVGAGYLLQAFIFGISPLDPITFIGAPLVLSAIALLASYLPARTATRVEPMTTLRQD